MQKFKACKKTLLRDPTAFFDQLLVHDCDLSSRSTKTDETEFEPIDKRLPKINLCGRVRIIRLIAKSVQLRDVRFLANHGEGVP